MAQLAVLTPGDTSHVAVWRFDLEELSWTAKIPAVVGTSPDPATAFWEIAVPLIAGASQRSRSPVVVIARCTVPPAPGRALPGGPRGRAKGLLDALHDDRRSGPSYVALSRQAPLADDKPTHVCGLAVEVVAGRRPQVEYLVGRGLRVGGRLLGRLPVDGAAPNDVSESARLVVPRQQYAAAVLAAWDASPVAEAASASAVVVHHRPARDEDNTWATWAGALTGAGWMPRRILAPHAPTAFASIADEQLETRTRYDFYA